MRDPRRARGLGARTCVQRALLGFAAVSLLAFAAACDSDSSDSGGSGLSISLAFTPPAAGTTDVVWLAEADSNGGLLLVDVLARDVAGPFDGYSVAFTFDPILVEAVSASAGTVLASCSPTAVLVADNIGSGAANASGILELTAALAGPAPPPCTLVGTQSLARVLFRARARGTSALDFVPYNGDPNNPGGSFVYRSDPAFAPVAVQFFDSGALIDVTR